MADKKTTKAAPKVTKKAEEVKTIDTLRADLIVKSKDLQDARRGNAAGELTNPRVITHTRKEIARLNFSIRALELDAKKENK